MKFSSYIYNIKQGLGNIFRNKMFSLASIATMTACLFMFGIFYALVVNFNYIIEQTEKTICITVFFDEGTTKNQIDSIGEQITAREEVYYITYTSAEEAWENYKKEHFKGYEELIEGFRDDNPLANSASYEVYLNDISKQTEIIDYLKSIEGIRSVNSSKAAAESLEQISKIVTILSLIIVSMLMLVSIFLISNTVTIGITVRKEEISIMKLIGATDGFVKAPFIVEGVTIGLLGSIIPLGIVYLCYDYALEYLLEKNSIILGSVDLITSAEIFSFLIPVTIITGVGIGLLGSNVTLRKHLKV